MHRLFSPPLCPLPSPHHHIIISPSPTSPLPPPFLSLLNATTPSCITSHLHLSLYPLIPTLSSLLSSLIPHSLPSPTLSHSPTNIPYSSSQHLIFNLPIAKTLPMPYASTILSRQQNNSQKTSGFTLSTITLKLKKKNYLPPRKRVFFTPLWGTALPRRFTGEVATGGTENARFNVSI